MNSKHTPGPWQAEGKYVGSKSKSICDGFGLPTDKEALANARLIAAAPELLEALKLFVNGQSKADFDAAHDAARSAIAKATWSAS